MKKALLYLFLLLGVNSLLSQVGSSIQIDSIESVILDEVRSYQIYLPPSYNDYRTSKKYSVVLVLDGERLFDITRSTIDFLSKTGKIPESIVVGISNTSYTPGRGDEKTKKIRIGRPSESARSNDDSSI
jgi:predicted alpha/beta superfamily hydrolase